MARTAEPMGEMAQTIDSRLRRLCVKAGVKHCIADGYRHSFATAALATGVLNAQVAALLGHSGTAMVHVYRSSYEIKGMSLAVTRPYEKPSDNTTPKPLQ